MRISRTGLTIAGALLAASPAALLSQPIYRCGNTYSQTPCDNSVVVRAHDMRTPHQKAQTDSATAQAALMAERMERDRLASEHRTSHGKDRSAKNPSTGQPTSMPATTEPTNSAAGTGQKNRSHSATKARPQPKTQPPDPFIATTRQEVKKKTATSPKRD